MRVISRYRDIPSGLVVYLDVIRLGAAVIMLLAYLAFIISFFTDSLARPFGGRRLFLFISYSPCCTARLNVPMPYSCFVCR